MMPGDEKVLGIFFQNGDHTQRIQSNVFLMTGEVSSVVDKEFSVTTMIREKLR